MHSTLYRVDLTSIEMSVCFVRLWFWTSMNIFGYCDLVMFGWRRALMISVQVVFGSREGQRLEKLFPPRPLA